VEALNELIVSWAASPFVLVVVVLLVVLDGFFPPMPSESVVVAVAAIGVATGTPNPWAVLLVAAIGSFVGDNLAFSLGRRVDLARFRWTRGPRAARLLESARGALDRRAASVILTARFVPVGRVAVNVMAGSTGFPRRRFVPLSAVSGAAWAGYSVLVGVFAGAWLRDQPVLGALVAVAVALAGGVVIDLVARKARRRRDSRTYDGSTAAITLTSMRAPGTPSPATRAAVTSGGAPGPASRGAMAP
jgi:membrane-associated protein